MLSPAVHESRDEPADVAVREPPRGRRDEPDVQVERVGRVGVPEEHRNRLYVPPPPRAWVVGAEVWRRAGGGVPANPAFRATAFRLVLNEL